jgi:diguanylate cyclase (GGDEF)-like protein
MSALGPLVAFVITYIRLAYGQDVVALAAAPLLFVAVLVGAAFAGRWSALSTVAIAAFGLLVGINETDRATTILTIAALVSTALVTGEFRDRAERAERSAEIAGARLKRVSLRDPLTGMLDRRGFELAIGVEIARETRRGGTLALLLIKLTDLALTNQRFGHSVSDTVIQVMADAVERRIRQSDVSARVADDAIAVILPDTDAAGTDVIAKHVLVRFHKDLEAVAPTGLIAGANYGVATFPSGGTNLDELLTSAERAMREVSGSARP